MSDPRSSTNYVDGAALRRYNRFKWLIALLLAALLLGLWGRSCQYARIAAPTLSGPAGAVGLGAVALTGTGAPGSEIDVRLAGQSVGRATVGADGNWSLQTQVAQPGAYEFVAYALDPDGRERGASQALRLTAGSTAPLAPTLNLPEGVIDPAAVTLSGAGAPGTTVEVWRNGQLVGETVVNADGHWSFTTAVDRYTNEFEAKGVDAAGASLGSSGVARLLAPAAAAALVLNSPNLSELTAADGDFVQGTLTIDGSAEPGTSVSLAVDGADIGAVDVSGDGRWEFAGAISAETGSHNLTARVIGLDGATIMEAPPLAFDIPALTVGAPSLSGAVVADDGTLTLTGATAPGAEVAVVIDGQVVATVTADANGNWVYSGPLAPGEHSLAAHVAGDPSRISPPQSVTVAGATLPTITAVTGGGPGQNAVTLSGQAIPGSAVELLVDGAVVGVVTADADGNWQYAALLPAGAFQMSARPAGSAVALSAPVAVAVGPDSARPRLTGAQVEDAAAGLVSWQGTAQPNAQVVLLVDGQVVETVSADSTGVWRHSATLSSGRHTLSARIGDDATAASEPIDVVIGAGLAAPGIAVVTTGGLNNGQAEITLAGSGAPNTSLEIFIDGAAAGNVTTDANGNWRFVTTQPAGVHQAAARLAADPTFVSAERRFNVGPTLKLTGIQRGAATADQSEVELSGTATPGAPVAVVVDGVVVGTVSADADGRWRYLARLPNGPRSLALRQLDASGAPAGETAAQDFTVGAPAGRLRVTLPGITGGAAGGANAIGQAPTGGPALEIILDASWSMTRLLGAGNRFDAARQVLRDLTANVLPTNTPVALRVFGNIVGNYACRTDLMLPLGPLDRAALDGILTATGPQFNANTPIAASLAQVSNDLAAAAGPRLVVLLTDGEETCGGDPAAEVQRLVDAGYQFQLNVVGLALSDPALKAEFERIAALSGGSYYDAADAESLSAGLQQAVRVPYRVLGPGGELVAMGQIGGAALSLPVGTYSVALFTDPAQVLENVSIVDGGLLTLEAK